MSSTRTQVSIGLQIGTFVVLWVGLILLKGIALNINWQSVKLLPNVFSIYVILHVVFVKWLWRLPMFKGWLVTIPDLQGTWSGQLQTTWIDPETGESLEPIKTYLVIRQTLYKIHVTMLTEESVSYSDAASVYVDRERGIELINFGYSNTPKAVVRERSEIHYGAARLRFSAMPKPALEGEYWTDRKSTGHISLEFLTKKLIERFPKTDT